MRQIFFDTEFPGLIDEHGEQTIELAFAMGTSESTCPQEGRLRQHHALDDAKANRLAWLATDGDIKAKRSTSER